MLIVCNGAPKGGSSWLMHIARALPGAERVPEAMQAPKFVNSSLADECVFDFLNAPRSADGFYYCKQHWYGEDWHRRILDFPHVKVLNIVRDVRDMMVSFYHHNVRLGHTDVDFPEFFRRSARPLLKKYIDYHQFWHAQQPEPFLVSYEGLKLQFDTTVMAMLRYLGVEANADTIDLLRKTDALHADSRMEVGEGNFWHKATMADWQNHLTPEMQDVLHSLCVETGYYDLMHAAHRRFPHLDMIYAK